MNIPLIIILLILTSAVTIFVTTQNKFPSPSSKFQEQVSSPSAEVVREAPKPTQKPSPVFSTQTPIPSSTVNTITSGIRLESVSPSTASVNSQLIIKGQKFGQNQGKVLIYAPGSTLYSSLFEIEKWSDTEIAVKLKFVGGGQFYTRVETADGQKSNELALTVIGGQPYIASVSPTSFKKGQTITINGYDFGSSAGKVNFNSNSGYGNLLGYGIIGSWTDTQIVFTVPPNLESKEYALEIITSDNQKSSYKYFNVND